MKYLLFTLLSLAVARPMHAQTFDEWFEQKKTQIKYLVRQIAELEIYTKDLEKGYQIVKDGLNVINDIRHDEFNLHNNYFTSLTLANPAVSKSSTVSECRTLIQYIRNQLTVTTSAAADQTQLSPPEQAYVAIVLNNLRTKTSEDEAQLGLLTSDGQYSLQDQQRQERITQVKSRLEDKYAFIKSFSAGLGRVSGSRTQEASEVQGISHMYQLN